jgi:Putative mono-oxygenase ydhR
VSILAKLGLGTSKVAAAAFALAFTAGLLRAASAGEYRPVKAFVYTEIQNNRPFASFPWKDRNPVISANPGFLYKTWLSGVNTNSIGGFYAFDSLENARKYVTGFFPDEQRKAGSAHATRVFDAAVTEEANRDIGSVDTGSVLMTKPAAFVYTEVQVNIPFAQFDWHERNKAIKKIPGLLSYTWLSGLNTNTVGGIYAFDTMENAKRFTTDDFPKIGVEMQASIYSRIFDGRVVEDAARGMKSPYFVMATN